MTQYELEQLARNSGFTDFEAFYYQHYAQFPIGVSMNWIRTVWESVKNAQSTPVLPPQSTVATAYNVGDLLVYTNTGQVYEITEIRTDYKAGHNLATIYNLQGVHSHSHLYDISERDINTFFTLKGAATLPQGAGNMVPVKGFSHIIPSIHIDSSTSINSVPGLSPYGIMSGITPAQSCCTAADMVEYVGFNDSFRYCKKCDKKESK